MQNKIPAGRLQKMLALALVIFLVLAGRMAWLQLYKGLYYGKQADGNRMRSTLIVAPRGRIMDRHGKVLADSAPGYVLYIRAGQTMPPAEMQRLAQLLKLPLEKVKGKAAKAARTSEAIPLKQELTAAEITALQENSLELPDISSAVTALCDSRVGRSCAGLCGGSFGKSDDARPL